MGVERKVDCFSDSVASLSKAEFASVKFADVVGIIKGIMGISRGHSMDWNLPGWIHRPDVKDCCCR